MSEEHLERIEADMRWLADELHAMRREIEAMRALLEQKPSASQAQPQPQLQFWPSTCSVYRK